MIKWLKKLFRIHEHERRLFLIGDYCVVKCVTCGMESIPWSPPKDALEAGRAQHANDVKEYTEIDRRCRGLSF